MRLAHTSLPLNNSIRLSQRFRFCVATPDMVALRVALLSPAEDHTIDLSAIIIGLRIIPLTLTWNKHCEFNCEDAGTPP